MLIADLQTSIARQAAFDAVVRVRTSTGQSAFLLTVVTALLKQA